MMTGVNRRVERVDDVDDKKLYIHSYIHKLSFTQSV